MREQVRKVLVEPRDACARESLHEYANAPVGHLEHPHDRSGRAVIVKIVADGFFLFEIALGDEHDHAILGERLFDGANRALALNKQRHDHEGKMTMSRSGNTGSESGSLTCSSLCSI